MNFRTVIVKGVENPYHHGVRVIVWRDGRRREYHPYSTWMVEDLINVNGGDVRVNLDGGSVEIELKIPICKGCGKIIQAYGLVLRGQDAYHTSCELS